MFVGTKPAKLLFELVSDGILSFIEMQISFIVDTFVKISPELSFVFIKAVKLGQYEISERESEEQRQTPAKFRSVT